ncbi:MAG: FAD:protein FMN transferase [Desulfobacteraceae bacterium]|nr:FAD:protein FMN transferase [Desulfobacteraceae bacterium]
MTHLKKFLLTLVFLSAFPLLTVEASAKAGSLQKHRITGFTMGTTYSVTVMGDRSVDAGLLKKRIDSRLAMVNQSMSMFSPTSELSRFNRSEKNVRFTISPDFALVIGQASRLYDLTCGAWDGTLKPLVDFWGFGTKEARTTLPAPGEITALLKQTGFHKIDILDNALQKKETRVTLDLGSIAKGFGVDAVARLIEESGFDSFIVEIGGEVFARGAKPGNLPWTVGISRPEKGSSVRSLYRSIRLRDKALATSGDYRNFVTIDNKSYSHIIDPTTGYPVDTGVVSASVIAADCTFADGLATALMVMPPEKGIRIVNSLDTVECLIVVRKADGAFQDWTSDHFPNH